MEKTCTKCKETKPVSEFHKYSRAKDGHNPHCKTCRSSHARKTHKKKNIQTVLVSEKRCTKCKTVKSASDFVRAKRTKTGLTSWCKECQNTSGKKWEERMKTRELPNDYKDIVKICSGCKKELSGSEFCLDKTNKDFLTSRCKVCISISYQTVLQYLQQKKKEMGGECKVCGLDELKMLEFDHLRDKNKEVSRMRSKKAVDREAEKCQLLCVKCHRRKSARERIEKYPRDDCQTPNKKIQTRNYDFVNKIKLSIGQCQICKIKIDPEDELDLCTFDFDHIDPTTKVGNVSNMCLKKFSIKRIQSEIEKCRLLCCFCHKKITWEMDI
jgi:hypothetical protein